MEDTLLSPKALVVANRSDTLYKVSQSPASASKAPHTGRRRAGHAEVQVVTSKTSRGYKRSYTQLRGSTSAYHEGKGSGPLVTTNGKTGTAKERWRKVEMGANPHPHRDTRIQEKKWHTLQLIVDLQNSTPLGVPGTRRASLGRAKKRRCPARIQTHEGSPQQLENCRQQKTITYGPHFQRFTIPRG